MISEAWLHILYGSIQTPLTLPVRNPDLQALLKKHPSELLRYYFSEDPVADTVELPDRLLQESKDSSGILHSYYSCHNLHEKQQEIQSQVLWKSEADLKSPVSIYAVLQGQSHMQAG